MVWIGLNGLIFSSDHVTETPDCVWSSAAGEEPRACSMAECGTVPAFAGIKDEPLGSAPGQGNPRFSHPLAPVSGHCAEESKQQRRPEEKMAGHEDEIKIETKSQVALWKLQKWMYWALSKKPHTELLSHQLGGSELDGEGGGWGWGGFLSFN